MYSLRLCVYGSNAVAEVYSGTYTKGIGMTETLGKIINAIPHDFKTVRSLNKITANQAYLDLINPSIFGTVYASGDGFGISRLRMIKLFQVFADNPTEISLSKAISRDCEFYNTYEAEWFDKFSCDRIAMIIVNKRINTFWVVLFQDVD